MCGFRKPIQYLEMILSLVASFSQSMSPWRDLIQVQISNYNSCVDMYSER